MVTLKRTALLILSAAAALATLLSGCDAESLNELISDSSDSSADTVYDVSAESLSNTNKSSDEVSFSNFCTITLGDETNIDGSGAWLENGILSITSGGVYTIEGTLSDGCIYIDTDENVKLVLNGVSVTNSSGAALYCYNAKNLYIELAEGTENYLQDGSSYTFTGLNESETDDEPDAALYSKDDLIICGSGSLTVIGNYNNGIRCNDDLTIESGNITVTAANNGIRGSDSLVIEDGTITVTAEKDGLKSTNDTDEGKGYVLISGGNITVNAGEDGIQAEQSLSITGGVINVTTTGTVSSGGNDMGFGKWDFGSFGGTDSSTASGDDEATSKGIKSSGTLGISGGEITVNSTDHCVHSAGAFSMTGGTLTLSSSSGKGISSHGDLQIDGGTIDVLNSTEGIESKAILTINGGDISIYATDDGLNAGGGSDSFGFANTSSDGTTHDLYINGGYIYIEAAGDGIDSNGNITINGGTIIVNGPTSGADGALDCGDSNNSITVTGGTLIAVGSSQMAEAPSSSSTQNCLYMNVSLSAGETVAIQDSSGNNVLVFTAAKQVQNIVFSSPDIKTGETYTVYTGVTASGNSTNGLYDNSASVSGGTSAAEVTVSSVITSVGNASGNGFGNTGGFGGGQAGGMQGGSADEMPDGSAGEMPDGSAGEMPDGSAGEMPDNLDGGMQGGFGDLGGGGGRR